MSMCGSEKHSKNYETHMDINIAKTEKEEK